MATSSASMAASRLFNLRTAALQNLVRGQILRPSAAVSPSPPDSQFNLVHPENRSSASINQSSKARNLNLRALNFPLDLQWRFGHSVMPIEAARTYVPSDAKDDIYDEFDEDDDEDYDDDDDDDEGEIQNYSGSDYDDDEYDDVDEDPDTRPRGRKSGN